MHVCACVRERLRACACVRVCVRIPPLLAVLSVAAVSASLTMHTFLPLNLVLALCLSPFPPFHSLSLSLMERIRVAPGCTGLCTGFKRDLIWKYNRPTVTHIVIACRSTSDKCCRCILFPPTPPFPNQLLQGPHRITNLTRSWNGMGYKRPNRTWMGYEYRGWV